ncbi:MAG TPA: trypsin-like peptidase domain-containing protein [Vicinamibacterales bacterium]|jgi:serine protease Do|nr:trypsin-like peptidase domain-containing protein [Vicinamibacterales bacterium]
MTRHAVQALLVIGSLTTLVPHVTARPREGDQLQPASIGARLFRDIARGQNPAVVSIVTRTRGHEWGFEEQEVFRLFGLTPPEPADRVERLLGSGFVISRTGEILTNYHVIEGATVIDVTLFGDDRKQYHAVVVGSDPLTDTALIKLADPPPNLQPVTFGDSSTLEPGDWVVAIGNPFRLGHTVTVGFVSFQGRPFQMVDGQWQDMIQTDAAINPGNSGGPLINVRGEVIGINTAIIDSDTTGHAGIGFAMPINTVKALLPQLRQGKVVRGQLGVQFHEGPILEDEARQLGLRDAAGALIMRVDGDSGAARAGLRAGDVIVEMDGGVVRDTRQLIAAVSSTRPGTSVNLTIFRDGAVLKSSPVVVEELPVNIVEPSARPASDDLDGLTLDELTAATANRLAVPPGVNGALVVDVALDSPADEAGLIVTDVIRAVNRRPVHTATETAVALREIEPHAPIFLSIWRRGLEVFLLMRKD